MVLAEHSGSKIFNLMKLDGETFVNESYALLLGRHPDREGFLYYMCRLNCGVSKRKIILQLLKAPEAIAMKEENRDFSREVDEWTRHTASIKYKLKLLKNISLKKKFFANSQNISFKLIDKINLISENQAIMKNEISALRTELPNSIDNNLEYFKNKHQMSRQAQHIYAILIKSTPEVALPCE